MCKRILKKRIDTRSLQYMDSFGVNAPGYTGCDVAKWHGEIVQEAIKGGYSGYELEYWDYCEGWTSITGTFQTNITRR